MKSKTKKIIALIVAVSMMFLILPGFKFGKVDEIKSYGNQDDTYVVSFLGDSITYGAYADESYADYFGELVDADVVNNYGICSNELCTSGTEDNAMVERYSEIASDSDLIFVCGGENDWWHSATLGELGDDTEDTYYGALEVLMTNLEEEYPDAEIVFATPPKCNRTGNVEQENENGDTLEDFANAVLEVAAEHGITVIDFYHADECDFTAGAYDNGVVETDYLVDGVHPTDLGHEILAKYIYENL